MWQAAWAFSGIRASWERSAPATLVFFHKNVWASLKKCPKCIEIWRQSESNSEVEATVLFFFEVQSSEIWVIEFRSVLCGRLCFCKKDSMVINKSCIINICKNQTEQRPFFVVVDLLQRAETGFLRSSESQTVSSRSAVVRSRCVPPPHSKVFLFFF